MSTIEQVKQRGALLLVIASLSITAVAVLYGERLMEEPHEGDFIEASATDRLPVPTEADVPYRFDEAVAAFSLPEELREISALTVLDERHLGAVQDEKGTLYVLDQESGEITAVMPFAPPGDFEGIELASGRLFALRADGALFEVEGWAGGETRLREYTTGLGKACDAEGLGFEASKDRLLIACKENGGVSGNRRSVYAFDLGAMALIPEPAFVVDPGEVEGAQKLKPSALAVHPRTGHVFVLCSVGMSLVAFSPDGPLVRAWDLEAAGFEQPEGIAFLPNGDVFIASEGDDSDPVLKLFAYQSAR